MFRSLAAQLLAGVLAILVITVSLGAYLYVRLSAGSLDDQYQQRAVGIANAVAQMPEISADVSARDPQHQIQPLAQRLRVSTGAAYVVVTDAQGLRYSHPNPALIGRRLEEPVAALDGRDHVGVDNGSLGRSANGRVPIRSGSGPVIGQVSVGILEQQVSTRERHEIAAIAAYSALALLLGGVASWILARRIKRVTYGLEPAEIASLLQEREAMLHGIREGIVGLDARQRVTVINGEAQRLLGIDPNAVGRPVTDVLPPSRLLELLTGDAPADDAMVLTSDFLLVVNRMPVRLAGHDIGSVVTLRDRTELESLVRELRSATGLSDALRAQEHEYANRLHVMAGLLELGAHQEAADYLGDVSRLSLSRADHLRLRIDAPVVVALLLAKTTVATEQDVHLQVTDESRLSGYCVDSEQVVTILGNLLDNAIEALAGQPGPRTITVHIDDLDGVHIVVSDNGPGFAGDRVDAIFVDGFTTKQQASGLRRGVGLALVHRIVRRQGGRIIVSPGPGARLEVTLPRRAGLDPVSAEALR